MNRDYGLDNRPVTTMFKQPQTAEEWHNYALNEDQIKHYKEYGFIKEIKILNHEQIESLTGELKKLADPSNPGNEYFYEYHSNESEDPDRILFHALGAWRVSPAFHDILWSPAFRVVAFQLLGKEFRLFHDQLFSKPARHGGVVAWHQDFSYWTWTAPMNHLTAWISLDDASVENGCMYYIPASHHWGLLKKTGLAGNMDSVREVLSAEQIVDFDNKIPIEMKRGYASFHHPLLMHGSFENKSDYSRRATLINVFADGVVSNRDPDHAPGADNYPRIEKGNPMGGPYYPLLIDPQVECDLLKDLPTINTV